MQNIISPLNRYLVLVVACVMFSNPAHAQGTSNAQSSGPDPMPMVLLQSVYANHGSPAPLTNENMLAFQTQVIEKPGLVMLEFALPTCLACNSTGKMLKELVSKYERKVDYLRFDLNHNWGLGCKYDISRVPAVLLFRDGQLLEKFALNTEGQKSHFAQVLEEEVGKPEAPRAPATTATAGKQVQPTN